MIDKATLDTVLPVPTLEELKEQKVAELKEGGFVVTNFHPGGVFYTILMIVCRIKIELLRLCRTILPNLFVSHATGIWLDLKVGDYGKWRKQAQKTQGIVTVTRSNGDGDAIQIRKGHIFKTPADINGEELRFFVTRAVTLQRDSLSAEVLVEAETEGSRYNVPQGQITKSLTYLGEVEITNGLEWITREGSDTEDDEALRQRTLRSWSELAQRATEDSFVNAAEAVPGVLFAQADCDHPRGQGTVDVIVTGTAGEATEELLEAVRAAVEDICGPYDDILVKSSIAVPQDIQVVLTTTDTASDEDIAGQITRILTELLEVKKGRKLYELYVSDINYAIRSGHSAATNAAVVIPAQDVILERDKVITLGAVTVEIRRE